MKRIDSIKLQREPYGDYENGFLIDEGDGYIFDMDGKILDEVFHYIITYDFNMDLEFYRNSKYVIENILKI